MLYGIIKSEMEENFYKKKYKKFYIYLKYFKLI